MKLSVLLVLVTLALLGKVANSQHMWDRNRGSTCGQSPVLKASRRSGRIVGGSVVQNCSVVPWQVRLSVHYELCGGSIISDRHILTAAHCLKDVRHIGAVYVIAAEYDLFEQDTFQKRFSISSYTMHPSYKPTTKVADIAVITLNRPITFDNPCTAPVCLDADFEFDGKTCTVSGWGRTSYKGQDSRYLKMAHLKTHLGKNCIRAFGIPDSAYIRNQQQMICAGHVRGKEDSCKGDSGGPLVCWNDKTQAFVQVGVVSYGRRCALMGYPGIYTNVAEFYPWIQKVMKENP